MSQTRLPLIQSWRRERERKENWREEFAWIRVVLTRKKYGRGISAPARTAINHIISVNGACKTREGSASLFALSYNTERSGTRAVVCPIVTTYYVEHVYSRWGASKWRGSWGATGCAATRSSLVSMVRLWNLDRSEDGSRIVLNYRFEMPPIK